VRPGTPTIHIVKEIASPSQGFAEDRDVYYRVALDEPGAVGSWYPLEELMERYQLQGGITEEKPICHFAFDDRIHIFYLDEGRVKVNPPLTGNEPDPLGLSIAKWRYVQKLCEQQIECNDGGADTCALCKAYLRKSPHWVNCQACPVMRKTGKPICYGIPYRAFLSYGPEQFQSRCRAARNIVRFLEGLREQSIGAYRGALDLPEDEWQPKVGDVVIGIKSGHTFLITAKTHAGRWKVGEMYWSLDELKENFRPRFEFIQKKWWYPRVGDVVTEEESGGIFLVTAETTGPNPRWKIGAELWSLDELRESNFQPWPGTMPSDSYPGSDQNNEVSR